MAQFPSRESDGVGGAGAQVYNHQGLAQPVRK